MWHSMCTNHEEEIDLDHRMMSNSSKELWSCAKVGSYKHQTKRVRIQKHISGRCVRIALGPFVKVGRRANREKLRGAVQPAQRPVHRAGAHFRRPQSSSSCIRGSRILPSCALRPAAHYVLSTGIYGSTQLRLKVMTACVHKHSRKKSQTQTRVFGNALVVVSHACRKVALTGRRARFVRIARPQ